MYGFGLELGGMIRFVMEESISVMTRFYVEMKAFFDENDDDARMLS